MINLIGRKNYLSSWTRSIRLSKWGMALEMGSGVASLLCLPDIRTWTRRERRARVSIFTSIFDGILFCVFKRQGALRPICLEYNVLERWSLILSSLVFRYSDAYRALDSGCRCSLSRAQEVGALNFPAGREDVFEVGNFERERRRKSRSSYKRAALVAQKKEVMPADDAHFLTTNLVVIQ